MCVFFSFFFFSSRRRHTRLVSDWSSDVCSSDLGPVIAGVRALRPLHRLIWSMVSRFFIPLTFFRLLQQAAFPPSTKSSTNTFRHSAAPNGWRSEERRVGKDGRARCSQYHDKETE